MDKRGFKDIDEMNQTMIEKWNAKVRKNDEVYILGDLSIGRAPETEEIVKRLNGRKFLIIGNHDKFLRDKKFNRNLFIEITPYKEMHDDRRKIILCHYPVFCYNGQYRRFEDGSPVAYMMYGHVHNTLDQELVDKFIEQTRVTQKDNFGEIINIPCNMINCFCMYSDYTPLSLDEWIELNEKRMQEKKDAV